MSVGKPLGGVGAAACLILASLSVAGCHASFCAGSGCSGSGTIDFGTSYKGGHGGGKISIVGKKNSFRLGQTVAIVAHLSKTVRTDALTLKVTRNGKAHSLKINLPKAKSNVVGAILALRNLIFLGVIHPGKYTFYVLMHSKQLAKGTMTEKR